MVKYCTFTLVKSPFTSRHSSLKTPFAYWGYRIFCSQWWTRRPLIQSVNSCDRGSSQWKCWRAGCTSVATTWPILTFLKSCWPDFWYKKKGFARYCNGKKIEYLERESCMYVPSIGKCCFIGKAHRHTNGRGKHKHAYLLGVLEICDLDFSGQNGKKYYKEHNRCNICIIESNCPSEKMVAITKEYYTMKWWVSKCHK